MRIVHFFQVLVPLLQLTDLIYEVSSHEHLNETLASEDKVKKNTHKNNHRHGRTYFEKRQFFNNRLYSYTHEQELKFPSDRILSLRQNKMLLEHEYNLMNRTGAGVDCCPSVLEMIEPDGGKNDQDIYVELYKSENYRQRFYELSCHRDVLNKPCRFIDKKLHGQSRCTQMYSYTYALVKDTPDHRNKNLPSFPGTGLGNHSYTLDYISVRSGCSCVVLPKVKKKIRKN